MSISTEKINNYWSDIDHRLMLLQKNGYVKLPPLNDLIDLSNLANKINNEMNGLTFAELGDMHKIFLDELRLDSVLTPKLFEIAKEKFGYNGNMSNQYHIARRVEPGNSKEMYRAHFDSHLFTIVFPINIPKDNEQARGDLIYFPNARKAPKNEAKNFFDKLYFKLYASKKGLNKFAQNNNEIIESFDDYAPLIFEGNTTLHTNKEVSSKCSNFRLTLLAHFFDPSPKYGIGNIIRLIRSR